MTNKLIIKKNILIIEDERPLVQVIEAKLKLSGFDTITARTIDQGFEYIECVKNIDAVWLDHYLLGEKTGIDFVAKLKSENSQWREIPIFVVSNTASNDNFQAYIRLGVNKYSVKADNRLDEMVNEIIAFLENPGGGKLIEGAV